MARGVPDEGIYQPEVNAQDVLPRKIIPRAEAGPVGPAVENLGESLNRKAQADAATFAGNQLADFHLNMMQQMEAMKANAQPGAQGYTADVLKQFDDNAKGLLQTGSSNPLVNQALTPGLRNLRAQFGEQAIAYEAQAGVQYRAQSAKDTVDKLALVANQNPDQVGDLIGQALTQVNRAGLDPGVTLQTAKYAQSVLAKSAIDGRIQTDPYAAMNALLKPDAQDAAVMAMTPEERETALSRADAMLHQRVSDAERLTSMTDRAEQENAKAGLSALIVQSQSPQGLTMKDVLAKAPLFTHEPQMLEAAMNLASGKNVETDPRLYADLLHRAMQGEDVFPLASAHLTRDLDKADFTKLVEMGDKGVPTPIRQGEEYINNAMRPGVMDKYNPVVNQSHANALDAYYDWFRGQKGQVSADQASSQARMIVGTYSLVDLSRSTMALPMPRFATGNRASLDPDQAAAATRQAELSGQISHDEAVKQMKIVADWRSAISRRQAAQAASQGTK